MRKLRLPKLIDPDARLEPYARTLVLISFSLMALGVLMVYSASATRAAVDLGDPERYVVRQLAWAAAGVATVWATMRLDPAWLRRFAPHLFGAVVVLLAAVLVVGPEVNGAHRWIRVGTLSFQPSEAAKLALVLWLAAFLCRRRHELDDWRRGVLPAMLGVGVVVLLVLAGPDFGTALFLGALGAVVMLVGGLPVGKLTLAALPAIPFLAAHVVSRWALMKRRFAVLVDDGADGPAVYQVQQSLVALGSGGVAGRGIGAGEQKLFFLPEAHTDFIFPVLGEELGFVGTALVVLLFAAFVLCGLRIAHGAASSDRFGCLLVFGLVFHVGLQAAGNIAVVTGSVPTKGIALPFISLGGSSLMVLCASVGIVYAVAARLDALRALAARPVVSGPTQGPLFGGAH